VAELRERIEIWRTARVGRARMPEGLWSEVVEWGRRYGACRVSRELGVDYGSLRSRLGVGKADAQVDSGFVELGGFAGWGSTRVEASRPDGCSLRIEVATGGGAEAAVLLQAFLGQAG